MNCIRSSVALSRALTMASRRQRDTGHAGTHICNRWVALAVALLFVVQVLVPGCNAKGVRSPSPTNEYLASYFDPSSTDDDDDDPLVDVANDRSSPRPRIVQCSCDDENASRPKPTRPGAISPADFEDSGRIDDIERKLATLESRMSDMERSRSKLKKLAMAAMSVALADEGERCTEAEGLGIQHLIKGFPAFTLNTPTLLESCDGLGTATKPASSCNHLKLACNKPSGAYYVDNGYFTQVYCEMDLFGGGWTRYGKAGKANEWNFVDEDLIEVRLQIMDPRDTKEMIDMKYNTFLVHTDVRFSLQADDSTNPSRISARILPWFHRAPFYIDGYGENFTRLEFLPGGDRITCRNTAGTSHKCGWGNVPKPNESSEQVLIESVYFGPRATSNGAEVYMDNWASNKYTWNGSYYYVYAK